MLQNPAARVVATTTTLPPGSSFFTPNKNGKQVAQTAPPIITIRTVVPRLPPRSPPQPASLELPNHTQSSSPPSSGHGPKAGGSSRVSSVSPLTSLSSTPSTPPKQASAHAQRAGRAKRAQKRSASSANYASDSDSDYAPTRPAKRVKKPRKRKIIVARNLELDPDPSELRLVNDHSDARSQPDLIYRSRSVSELDSNGAVTRAPWDCEALDDGDVGDELLSCEKVILSLMPMYKPFFRGSPDYPMSFEADPVNYPYVDLEYPNTLARERFILLEPRDKDHYNPIMCLEDTLYTIVEYYLTPEQRELFGKLPKQRLSGLSSAADDNELEDTASIPQDLIEPSELPMPPTADEPQPAHSPPRQATPTATSVASDLLEDSKPLRRLSRAIHSRNGPAFVDTMKEINHILRSIKYPSASSSYLAPSAPSREPSLPGQPLSLQLDQNPMRGVPRAWSRTTGVPTAVARRIIDETYQRAVGPHVPRLKKYTAFSSSVYGELMPSLVTNMLASLPLTPDSLFVDLGSGVGNVVVQAALETGCKGYGVEILNVPANIGTEQEKQWRLRMRLWGIRGGSVKLEEGDMLKHPGVDEALRNADVVLVNNYVFKEELNVALSQKFLDLKEGAIVVSLKPFAPPTSSLRITERNLDDMSSIFDVRIGRYRSGDVSWSGGDGVYYIHKVDREGYARCRERWEKLRRRSSS